MATTAVNAVYDAIDRAIKDGQNPPKSLGGLTLLGPVRVYRNKAPLEAKLGYFLFGQVTENEGGFYNDQAGQDGIYRIHCWSDTAANATRLYGWLKGLIHGKKLALEGNTIIQGELSRADDAEDPSRSAWQVAGNYVVSTLEDLPV